MLWFRFVSDSHERPQDNFAGGGGGGQNPEARAPVSISVYMDKIINSQLISQSLFLSGH